MRLYRKVNGLPAKRQKRTICAPSVKKAPAGMDELKGYEVKGDGTVIQYGSKNTR